MSDVIANILALILPLALLIMLVYAFWPKVFQHRSRSFSRASGVDRLTYTLVALEITELVFEPATMAWADAQLGVSIAVTLVSAALILSIALRVAGPTPFLMHALLVCGLVAFVVTLGASHGFLAAVTFVVVGMLLARLAIGRS